MIIELNSSKNELLNRKYKRFKELNTRYFMQNITDEEEIEKNEIENWLKIHNN